MTGPGVLYVPPDAHIPEHGFRLSLVFPDESGHYPTGTWPYEGKPGQKMPWFINTDSYEEAQRIVRQMNEDQGFSAKEAAIVIAKSMAIKP